MPCSTREISTQKFSDHKHVMDDAYEQWRLEGVIRFRKMFLLKKM
jgi:hypothetical protein